MSSYILVLEEKIKAFSIVSNRGKSSVALSIKGNNEPLKVLNTADKVIGFVGGNSRTFCYLFEAIHIEDEDKIYFDKILELKEGAQLQNSSQDIQDEIYSREQMEALIPISDEQYTQILSLMAASAISLCGETTNNKAIAESITAPDTSDSKINYKTGYNSKMPRNRIVFGAPGTGKSFAINADRKKLLGNDNEDDYERVTFHPDYSYANFVGTYKPVMKSIPTTDRDPNVDYIVSVLTNKEKSAQEKYDTLFEQFKDNSITRLPVLLGLYTDEVFKTRKADGSATADDNANERNIGKSIRKYVNLINENNDCKGDISYEYVPGPFMRMYVKALKNSKTKNPKPYLLIIEEINRANVAAVFGEIFQLLDRDENNISEYPIQASEDIKKYLSKELGGKPSDYSQLRIPDNLFIWATMNSADQGVFPMDTAFKRRWEFTYLGIDENDKEIKGKYVVLNTKKQQRFEWNELRKAINEFLANEKINEDKQLGPYFISRKIVVPNDGGDEIDSKRFCDAFKNKVLMYLFEDAAKQKRGKLFEGCEKGQSRYSKICEAFDEQGIGIFAADIRNKIHLHNPDTINHTTNSEEYLDNN